MKRSKRTRALALSGLMLLAGCGAADAGRSRDLMAGVPARAVQAEMPEGAEAAVDGFAVRLLQSCPEGRNALVSPVSVLAALGMTANGAAGETRTQMEEVLGLPVEDLNACVRALAEELPEEKDCAVGLANAIWLRDAPDLTVEPDFLQTNAGWYGAGAYRADFDASTVEDINGWVRRHTGGMIDGILTDIPEDAMLYLVNAVSFDAEWAEPYRDTQVREGTFTAADGASRTVDFLYGAEYRYLTDQDAQGFCKPYAGGRYAFLALLPEEGVSIGDYVAGLTGERLAAALAGASEGEVLTAIPKFQAENSLELAGALRAMGMEDAFDPFQADFSAMGRYGGQPLYISRVLHKTKLAVDERGTKAGAAAAVEMDAGGAAPGELKEVYLDRPFVYGLIDLETGAPLFLGALLDPGE